MHSTVQIDESDRGIGGGFRFRMGEDAGKDGDYGEDQPHEAHRPEEKRATTHSSGQKSEAD